MRESRKAREGLGKKERGKEEERERRRDRRAGRLMECQGPGGREGKKVGDMKWQNERVTDVKRRGEKGEGGSIGVAGGCRGGGGGRPERNQTWARRNRGTSANERVTAARWDFLPSIECAASQSVLRSGAAPHCGATCEGVGKGLLKTHENKVSSLVLFFFFFFDGISSGQKSDFLFCFFVVFPFFSTSDTKAPCVAVHPPPHPHSPRSSSLSEL